MGRGVPKGFVIHNPQGMPLCLTSLTSCHVQPTLGEARIWDGERPPPYDLHSFRHVAVSLWIDAGMSLMQVSKLIGHSKVSTTLDIYGHLFPQDQLTRTIMDRAAESFAMGPGAAAIDLECDKDATTATNRALTLVNE